MTGDADFAWFPPCRPRAAPAPALNPRAVRLFCLPHSGAGASTYRTWITQLAPEVDVVPVQLPGRESLHREPLLTSIDALVARLRNRLLDRVEGPFAIFGHSMGALLGYELAHEFMAAGRPPVHLFVSGLEAPHPNRDDLPLHELPDAELLAVVNDLGGTSSEVFAEPELVRVLLPVLRADLTARETYEAHHEPLALPLTVMSGREDPSVDVRRLASWTNATSRGFTLRLFDGGHFYHHNDPGSLFSSVRESLALGAQAGT